MHVSRRKLSCKEPSNGFEILESEAVSIYGDQTVKIITPYDIDFGINR